jgi:hypothetical protein
MGSRSKIDAKSKMRVSAYLLFTAKSLVPHLAVT